jgi:hypothetical protein
MEVLQKSVKKSKPSEVFSKFKKWLKNSKLMLLFAFLTFTGFWIGGFLGGVMAGNGLTLCLLIPLGKRHFKKYTSSVIQAVSNNQEFE